LLFDWQNLLCKPASTTEFLQTASGMEYLQVTGNRITVRSACTGLYLAALLVPLAGVENCIGTFYILRHLFILFGLINKFGKE
jgi:hypothetical protein